MLQTSTRGSILNSSKISKKSCAPIYSNLRELATLPSPDPLGLFSCIIMRDAGLANKLDKFVFKTLQQVSFASNFRSQFMFWCCKTSSKMLKFIRDKGQKVTCMILLEHVRMFS